MAGAVDEPPAVRGCHDAAAAFQYDQSIEARGKCGRGRDTVLLDAGGVHSEQAPRLGGMGREQRGLFARIKDLPEVCGVRQEIQCVGVEH